MNSRAFLALLLSAISVPALVAAQPVRPDDQKAREEKQERLLVTRCQTMLDLQTEVHKDTVRLYKIIEATADKKPRAEDKKATLKLADKMKEIVKEATKAREMLERDGAALAFSEAFDALRKDMKEIQALLEKGDVGHATQALQVDTIENLKEMLDALRMR